jgi:ferredoxin
MSRRELFGLFRAKAEAEPEPEREASTHEPVPVAEVPAGPAPSVAGAPFSLDTFYAARSPAPALPAFAVKADVAVSTTRVGLGRTEAVAAAAVPAAAAAVALPAHLVPRVLEHNCLATRSFCSICVERCPRDGAIVIERGRPRIVEQRCDGCGHCIPVCPSPILALELVPRPAQKESR